MADLAVVIVTWNSARDIAAALRSLLAEAARAALAVRVVVVDSASTDETVAIVRQAFGSAVELLALRDNVGFARANNIGMRHLGYGGEAPAAPFVLLLNPDTITLEGALTALCDALLRDAGVGVAGAQLRYGDHSFQHGAFGFPGLRQLYAEFCWIPGRLREGRFNGRYPRRWYQQPRPFDVDFVLGACMMLRAGVIADCGLFDEGYFMYAEEVDWQWRIRRAGWRIVCAPAAHIIHLGGQSSRQVQARSLQNLWESRLRLFARFYPPWKLRAARALVRLGLGRQRQRWARQHGRDEVAAAYDALWEKLTQP